VTELIIPARYNGPVGSGNGGFSAGRIASFLTGDRPVEVTLRRPPPLDRALAIRPGADGGVTVADGPDLVATARPVGDVGAALPPVSAAVATAAMTSFAGRADHPFPTCFVCGTQRPGDDGLRVWPGVVATGDSDGIGRVVASTFRPRADLTEVALGAGPAVVGAELLWSALDCPGGWATLSPGRAVVLGRMAAALVDRPAVGEECVVVGRLDEVSGRKAVTRTICFGADGRELGRALATWIEIRP
jgi:hypothetical protein